MQANGSVSAITQEESQRIGIFKVWLTLMVVFIHSYMSDVNFVGETVSFYVPRWLSVVTFTISQVFSRIAVPTFFFLSAYFLYQKKVSWSANIIKKIRTLVIPYLLLNTFWIVIYFATQSVPRLMIFFPNPRNIVADWNLSDWLTQYFGSPRHTQPVLYPLWFVRDLFIFNLLAPVFEWVVKKTKYFAAAVFVILWLTVESSHIFCMDIQGICFWGLGCFFAVHGIRVSSFDRHKILLAITYSVLAIATVLFEFYPVYLPWYVVFFVTRLGLLVGIAFWYVFTTKIKGAKIRNMLLFVSGYSFCIYLFHEMSLSALRKILTKMLPQTTMLYVLLYLGLPVIVVSGCLLLSRLLDRYLPKVYRIISGGRSR